MSDEHTFSIDGHKFKFGIRDLIYVVGLVVAAALFYFTSKNADAQHDKAIAALDAKYEMLVNGLGATNDKAVEARRVADGLQYQVNQNTKSLTEIASEVHNLTPKMEKIDVNVLWLMGKQVEKKP